MNDKFVQVVGPFTANENIVSYIIANNPNFTRIKKCGIQAEKTHNVNINGQDFEIGKTEILEFNEVHITSLYFTQDEPATTVVDCILD